MSARVAVSTGPTYLNTSVHTRLGSLNRESGSVHDPEGVIAHFAVHDAHDLVLATRARVDSLQRQP